MIEDVVEGGAEEQPHIKEFSQEELEEQAEEDRELFKKALKKVSRG
jgi:hypothetical protein